MSREKKQDKRGRILADHNVQGKLLLHILVHWCAFLVGTAAFLLFAEMLSGNPRDAFANLWDKHVGTLLAVTVLAPIFVYDLIKFSDRFAGPIVRLRREMKELAEGKCNPPLRFRDADFWKELADDFNVISNKMHSCSPSQDTIPVEQAVVEANHSMNATAGNVE